MDQLRVENNTEEKRTVSLLYEVIYKDSNSNKQLDPRDKITISLSKIDGSEFKNVIESADSLIDHNVSRDGKEVALIYQVNKKVIMERVSLESFQSISKSELTQVEKI